MPAWVAGPVALRPKRQNQAAQSARRRDVPAQVGSAGVWRRLHRTCWIGLDGRTRSTEAAHVSTVRVCESKVSEKTGSNPTGRGQLGSWRDIIADANRISPVARMYLTVSATR